MMYIQLIIINHYSDNSPQKRRLQIIESHEILERSKRSFW